MSKFRNLLLVLFALSLLPLVGCSLSSYQKAEMDKTLEDFYVTRFEFGTLGDVDVATSKKLVIDGRDWNFSELLASVFQDAMKGRGIPVGKLTPTKGGAFLLDDLRVAGRTLLLSPVWYPSGSIRAAYMPPRIQNANAKAIKAITQQSFSDVGQHYENDEAFYEGLKAEHSWSPFVRQLYSKNKIEPFVVHAAFLPPSLGSGPSEEMPLYTSSGVWSAKLLCPRF